MIGALYLAKPAETSTGGNTETVIALGPILATVSTATIAAEVNRPSIEATVSIPTIEADITTVSPIATTGDVRLVAEVGGHGDCPPSTGTQSPTITLSIEGETNRAFGDPANVVINWVASKGGAMITAITVAGQAITPTGESQTGSITLSPNTTATEIYAATIEDSEGETGGASVAVRRLTQYFWGVWDGVGGFDSADLISLQGRGLYDGGLETELASVNGGDLYFTWALPANEVVSFSTTYGAIVDNVSVSEGEIENQYGVLEDVQVWRSKYRQAGESIPITVEVN